MQSVNITIEKTSRQAEQYGRGRDCVEENRPEERGKGQGGKRSFGSSGKIRDNVVR